MNRQLTPGPRRGRVKAPASKSQGHRLLIGAALGREETLLRCPDYPRDLAATAACLKALGAGIRRIGTERIAVTPVGAIPRGPLELPCGESGATLRFLLPIAGALGAEAVFLREGNLPARPIRPLTEELTRHGMRIEERGSALLCEGKLRPGAYSISGELSSQYASGLLLALPLLEGDSSLTVTGRLASPSYLTMTEDALARSGIVFHKQASVYRFPGEQRFSLPGEAAVEGDWSGAAVFLCMGALSPEGIEVTGLNPASLQGDREILALLRQMGAEVLESESGALVRRGELRALRLDAERTPDLIPVLCALAALAGGETVLTGASRLRLKESDRLRSVAELLRSLGGSAEETPDGLRIRGRQSLNGGTADSAGDHRIAMAAAVAACGCTGTVSVRGADCVEKSYPRFWTDWESLEETET